MYVYIRKPQQNCFPSSLKNTSNFSLIRILSWKGQIWSLIRNRIEEFHSLELDPQQLPQHPFYDTFVNRHSLLEASWGSDPVKMCVLSDKGVRWVCNVHKKTYKNCWESASRWRRIRIQHFTLRMRIRIWLLIKVMRVCNHWPADPPRLHFEPPQQLNFEWDADPAS